MAALWYNVGMAWNRSEPGASQPTPKKKPSALHGVIAGAVVVAAAVAVFFVMSGKDEKPKAKVEKEAGRIKEVKPAAAPTNAVEVVKDAKQIRREKLAAMTGEERRKFLLDELAKKPINLKSKVNKPYRNGTEQIMAKIFMTKPGNMPPPLPRLPIRDELHMAEILISPLEVFEEDTQYVKEAKQAVETAKAELRKYIKEGGDVESFLDYYHKQLVQSHREWHDAQRAAMKLIKTDPDLAPAYVKQVNERLASRGIKPLHVPTAYTETSQKE